MSRRRSGEARLFWTRRGAVRWAAERNPYRPETLSFAVWLRDFWRDQADRGWARARVLFSVAMALGALTLLLVVLQVIA